MLDAFDATGTSRHRLRYHMLLVTRRRAPRFEEEAVRVRVAELLREAAEGEGCEVLDVEVGANWALVRCEVLPTLAPAQLAYRLRRQTSPVLSEEVDALRRAAEQKGSVWTRQYLVTTEPIDEAVREAFVAAQPVR